MIKNWLSHIFVLVTLSSIAASQTITENFGPVTSSDSFSIEFVEIGNPGNQANMSVSEANVPYTAGAVGYKYHLSKYEINREIIQKAISAYGLDINMYDFSSGRGSGPNKPAAGISWFEAAKFVNYLNLSTTNQVAYKFDSNGSFQLWTPSDNGYNANNPFRNSFAKFVLPNFDEWYKGAFSDESGNWFKYANGTNVLPDPVPSGGIGAVWSQDLSGSPADVNNAGNLSPWGTTAQNGNVNEWIESWSPTTSSNTSYRFFMGGSYLDGTPSTLSADSHEVIGPGTEAGFVIGFRVAMVPEPSALSLLAVGLGGLAMMRRRRS